MTAKTDLRALHKKSSRHRSSLARSKVCGCFYCFREFRFEQIREWIDGDETALCPFCGVDAVLAFDTPKADQELLHRMHDCWFKRSVQLTRDEWNEAAKTDVWPRRVRREGS